MKIMLTKIEDGHNYVYIDLQEIMVIQVYIDNTTQIIFKSGRVKEIGMEFEDFVKIYEYWDKRTLSTVGLKNPISGTDKYPGGEK